MEKAMIYNDLLNGMDSLISPYASDDATHVYHVYAVRTQKRDELLKYLASENIFCGIHYPVPIHLQAAYSNMGVENNDLTISERVASEWLSLPMFPELSEDQQIRLKDKIQEFIFTTCFA